jgi:hypothetical protein
MIMSLEQFGYLAEIVAAIAVVASLVYLAHQIRMTRKAEQTAAFQSIATGFTHHLDRFFSAEDELALRGLRDRSSLSDADCLLFDHLLANLLSHAEMADYAVQSKMLTEAELEPMDWWLREKLFCYPGAREWLEEFSDWYAPSYLARLRRAAAAADDSSALSHDSTT